MANPFRLHQIAVAAASGLLLLGSTSAGAAGFQLNEVSASGLGNAYAGAAAVAEDASTLWSNPAGLSKLSSRQVVSVVHLITPSIQFSNGASAAASQQVLGGNGGDAGGLNVVPNLYVAMPLSSTWAVGVGVTAPWGLVTEYDAGWVGRFQGIRSDIMTLNINPGISFKASPGLAIGLGLNAQRMLAEFTNQVNYAAVLLRAAGCTTAPLPANCPTIGAAATGLESFARIHGSDNAYGWNVGVLWDLGPQQRVGLHYRSAVKYQLDGTARFTPPGSVPAAISGLASAVNAAADTAIRADVEMPPIANLSYFGALGNQWDLMADLQWTGWSTIETLRFDRADGTLLQSTPEQFKDSWKLAIGANYKPGGAWIWRMGLAVDQSPVQDAFRTPRLPDSNRTWVTGGAQFKLNPQWRFDLGAAYVFSKKATISADGGAAAGLLNGQYNSHTVIVSGQATWAF